MPSPIGHALGGIAAGWSAIPRRTRAAAWTLAVIGAAPDLDLLVHAHRGPSHSVGAALLAGLVVLAVTRDLRWGTAATLAWASHVLLDWLGDDTAPPIGIPVWWPFSSRYFRCSAVVFPGVSRSFSSLQKFVMVNGRAAAVEVAILLPLVALVVWLTRARQRSGP